MATTLHDACESIAQATRMKVDRRGFLGSAVAALAAKGGIVPRAVKAA